MRHVVLKAKSMRRVSRHAVVLAGLSITAACTEREEPRDLTVAEPRPQLTAEITTRALDALARKLLEGLPPEDAADGCPHFIVLGKSTSNQDGTYGRTSVSLAAAGGEWSAFVDAARDMERRYAKPKQIEFAEADELAFRIVDLDPLLARASPGGVFLEMRDQAAGAERLFLVRGLGRHEEKVMIRLYDILSRHPSVVDAGLIVGSDGAVRVATSRSLVLSW